MPIHEHHEHTTVAKVTCSLAAPRRGFTSLRQCAQNSPAISGLKHHANGASFKSKVPGGIATTLATRCLPSLFADANDIKSLRKAAGWSLGLPLAPGLPRGTLSGDRTAESLFAARRCFCRAKRMFVVVRGAGLSFPVEVHRMRTGRCFERARAFLPALRRAASRSREFVSVCSPSDSRSPSSCSVCESMRKVCMC